jgi:hypothetical protein
MSNNEQCFYIQYPKYKKIATTWSFCRLHSPVGVFPFRFQQKSAGIVGLHFPLSFQFGKYTNGIFDMFIGDGSRVFRKNSSGNAEHDVSVTCYTAWHRMMKLDPEIFRIFMA